MNERIRELYIQAIHATKHHPADDVNVQIAEKFAELIVKDCASMVDNEGRFLRHDNLAKKIRKHFGVE